MIIKRIGYIVILLLAFGAYSFGQPVPPSVVYIECRDNAGSITKGAGVLVSEKGYVLTAKHVVPVGYDCKGSIGTAATTPSRSLIRYGKTVDVDAALMRFTPSYGESFPYLAYVKVDGTDLAGKELSAYGFNVTAAGDPGGVTITSGTLGSTIPNSLGIVKTDVLTSSGMSGAPVVMKGNNALVGIVAGAEFDPNTGSPSYYGVLVAELVATEFSLVEITPDGNKKEPQEKNREDQYGPEELDSGQVKNISLDLQSEGPVDFLLQNVSSTTGDDSALEVWVIICSSEDDSACKKKQVGVSRTLRQRLPAGPGYVSIFNFNENPKITITYKITKPL
ncbi:trypsin-like peptidase domain-containing protein [Pseudomonas sp. DSP3-2-2]|uniref:S1 family peptidase n=1 Tax=unclassified Pseudomonas TaxID=196821 RepID=UPI003CEEFF28